MYHPSRGGVRGGRDQFSWDDVKADKHRENYLGHSIKAPVGRWQKGKDLHWYTRDKKEGLNSDSVKEEIQRIKEEEEQAMREALGLAPKRAARPHGSRLDKHEFSELVKRGSTAEDVGAGHAEAARVQGLGFSRDPSSREASNSSQLGLIPGLPLPRKTDSSMPPPATNEVVESEDEGSQKKRRRRDESKREKHGQKERQDEKHGRKERRQSRDSDEKRRHKKDREKRRPHSD